MSTIIRLGLKIVKKGDKKLVIFIAINIVFYVVKNVVHDCPESLVEEGFLPYLWV